MSLKEATGSVERWSGALHEPWRSIRPRRPDKR